MPVISLADPHALPSMFQPSVVPAEKREQAYFFRVPLRIKIDSNAGLPVMLPALLMDISGGGCQIVSRILVEVGAR